VAIICVRCQNVVPDEAQFCSSCGAQQTSSDPHNAETLKQTTDTNDQLSPTLKPTASTYDQHRAGTGNHDPASHDPRIGLVLDSKYQLVERLGQGAMGSVYRARRLHIGDDVAVKLMSRDLIRKQSALERFRREARSAAMIRHPNVVTIHDFSEADDQNGEAYIVMELVKGDSLRKVLERESRLSPERAVELMSGVCAGVGAAHRQGLLHRDLKPDNVIVTLPSHYGERETAKVVDFGLAKVRDAADVSALTQTGTLLGTLYYMSPEQCRGEALDARADVYSLAAMLYETLTGQPPFVASNPVGLIAKHLSEAPPEFDERLLIPATLRKACVRGLAKNREERQPDATAFRDELQALTAEKHPESTIVLPSQTRGSRSALRWFLGVAVVFVLAIGSIGLGLAVKFGFFGAGRDKPKQDPQEQSKAVSMPAQAPTSESEVTTTSVTAADLRGTWTGKYGPLGQPATLVVKSQKGDRIEGTLEQGSILVAFDGTIRSGTINLKQTKVIRGEGWSLGEDTGKVSDDGKSMSGTGKDATGELLGMSYNWSFTRP
jgi:serine/threonine protein kinase